MIKSIDIKYRLNKNSILAPAYCIVVNKTWIGDLVNRLEPDDWIVYLNLDEQRRARFNTRAEAKRWVLKVITKYLAWRNLVTGPKIIKAHNDYVNAANEKLQASKK